MCGGHRNYVKKLLKRKESNIDTVIIDNSNTPLHVANAENDVNMAKLLTEFRASNLVINKDDKTSMNLVLERGHAEMAEFLIRTKIERAFESTGMIVGFISGLLIAYLIGGSLLL